MALNRTKAQYISAGVIAVIMSVFCALSIAIMIGFATYLPGEHGAWAKAESIMYVIVGGVVCWICFIVARACLVLQESYDQQGTGNAR